MVSPSRCPPWQPERPGPTRREPRRAQRSYTTRRDTIASFGETNLVEAGGQDLEVLSGEDGSTITVLAQDLSAAGLGIDSISLGTPGDAAAALSAIDGAIDQANAGVAQLGSAAQTIAGQAEFTTRLDDVLNEGLGNLVDANLAEEAAGLQANQVKQELGLRTLAIANAGPRALLSLFP